MQSFIRFYEDEKLDTYRMTFRLRHFKTNKILSISEVNNEQVEDLQFKSQDILYSGRVEYIEIILLGSYFFSNSQVECFVIKIFLLFVFKSHDDNICLKSFILHGIEKINIVGSDIININNLFI